MLLPLICSLTAIQMVAFVVSRFLLWFLLLFAAVSVAWLQFKGFRLRQLMLWLLFLFLDCNSKRVAVSGVAVVVAGAASIAAVHVR